MHGAGKTVLTCLMDEQIGRKPISAGKERLPNYAFSENAARVLGKLAHYSEWSSQPAGLIPEFNNIDPITARKVLAWAVFMWRFSRTYASAVVGSAAPLMRPRV